jgi:anaerobic selenocysteine-containing dehydrogenase
MSLTRRDFIRIIGGGTLITTSGCLKIKGIKEKVFVPPGGIEKWVPSVCRQCSGGCGILARVIDDRVVKLEGNPLHPINRGTLCPKGHAGLQVLYDPDRIRYPLKRIGNRGEDKWKKIGWDEAIKEVSEKLKGIRKKDGAHTISFISGTNRGLMDILLNRFLEAIGSPNYILSMDDNEDIPIDAVYTMQGVRNKPLYDISHTNYILSFGTSLLESILSPVEVLRSYGDFRRGREGLRGRLVHIGSRLSVTGVKADKWIPINPGTEGVLALGIAHIIIKEFLYDDNFISNHTFGFNDWVDSNGKTHTGFRSLVLKEYPPSIVSEITSVPVDQIVRIAKEFATSKPSLAITYRGGIYDQMAVHSLNALVGNFDIKGGILISRDPKLYTFPEVHKDSAAKKGLSMPSILDSERESFRIFPKPIELFPERIKSKKPYKINALLIYNSNPLFSMENGRNMNEALKDIPFIVSFSSFMDETSKLADLILPDHTYLERWGDDAVSTIDGYPIVSLSQPVSKPLYNTMHTGDVILKIAKNIGGSVGDSFPWKDFKDLLFYSLKHVYEHRSGDIFGAPFETYWTTLLAKGGWWSPSYKSFDEFMDGMLTKGGWWEPIYYYKEWDRIFLTPSKRFEFYSNILKEKIPSKDDKIFLPHYKKLEFHGDERDYPFYLDIYRVMSHSGITDYNQPWLKEILSPQIPGKWESWVEINPESAKKIGISDGDMVWVESIKGRIKLRAKLYTGIVPEVVSIPLGLGENGNGRWNKNIGINPKGILAKALDPLSGIPVWYSTRVRIYKA